MNSIAHSDGREDNFLYLNRDNEWPGFHFHGLEVSADGVVHLQRLPLLVTELTEEVETAEEPDGPAGMAIDGEGNLYFTDPAASHVWKLDACDSEIHRFLCREEIGTAPAQLNTPRGLSIPAFRHSLMVADSGNHRVQLFDLNSRQLVDIWGPTIQSQETTNLKSFDTPWALAADADGNVYVLDRGRAVIHKFDPAGEVVSSFADTILHTGILSRPVDLAVQGSDQTTRVYVIDHGHNVVFVFDQNGNCILDNAGQPLSVGTGKLSSPLGIAVSEEAIYVGDNQLRRILKFVNGGNYEFVGEAIGFRGPVAALALDNHGSLFVHTGASRRPLKLTVNQGYRTQGFLWSDPIVVDKQKVTWHRLQARIAKRVNGALRLFVYTANDQSDNPQVDPNPESLNPFVDPRWVPLAGSPDPFLSVDDLFINREPSSTFWVAALLHGDGKTSPALSQLRLEFNHSSYLKYLPAIYNTEKDSTRFLLRFLSLFETFFEELEESIADLPSLFDPQTVTREFLSWLAGWLALELDQNWDEQTARGLISRAFEIYGRRGTVEGLRECLSVFAGVKALITEPILDAAWFCLPSPAETCACQSAAKSTTNKAWKATENSILGVTSMLAPGHPQGAVLGTTATLDHSNLLTNEQFGAPLFAEVAHRFNVLVYQSQLNCAETLPKIRAAIEREMPAHTVYHLCTIQPRMRVGFQARVGIDSVVGGLPRQAGLGTMTVAEDVIGGEPQGFLGPQNRVGINTRIG